MKRTLSLRRETLSVLDAEELAYVAGAAEWTFPQCQTQLVRQMTAMVVSLTPPIPTLNSPAPIVTTPCG